MDKPMTVSRPVIPPPNHSRGKWRAGLLLGMLLASLMVARVWADGPETLLRSTPVAFAKESPETVADLLAMEEQIRKISKAVIPATVNLQVGNAQGSGVIVSKEGEILTAAHVIGRPGRSATIILSDGRRIKGETMGLNRDLDIGLVKITDKGDWPTVEMGDMKNVKIGDWCLATGHPGGYRKARPPVVRLGRVILKRSKLVQTDCTLVGGDSGGPVFDMDGKVIGINSRIGASTDWNFHVPVSAYQDNWDKLVKAEAWSDTPGPMAGGPILGVSGEQAEKGCRLTQVADQLPAHEAGLQVGDIITSFDGKPVDGFESLAALVQARKPGDRVRVEFLRGDEALSKMVKLAERS
jgi:serine protease Do